MLGNRSASGSTAAAASLHGWWRKGTSFSNCCWYGLSCQSLPFAWNISCYCSGWPDDSSKGEHLPVPFSQEPLNLNSWNPRSFSSFSLGKKEKSRLQQNILFTGISEILKNSTSVEKYQIAIKNQLEDHVTFMEGTSNEQMACKGIVRTAERYVQLTQWMKNTVGKCFHCMVGSFYL